jgi:DNA-binding SARP family transcriptional activator
VEHSRLDLKLLGRFSVRRGGEEIPQAAFGGRLTRTLLRILVTRRGTFASKDFLADALWPERPPADPDGNLEILVSRARRALGEASLILTGPRGYAFAPDDRCLVDAEEFTAWVEAGRNFLESGQAVSALDACREALLRWGGEPLPEDAYSDWASDFRQQVQRTYLAALEGAATAALAGGHPDEAVAYAERAVAREPLREASHLLLIRALAVSGDQAGALMAFDKFRRQLVEELGIDPSPAADELHVEILQGKFSTSSPSSRFGGRAKTGAALPPASTEIPFVGREAELDVLLSVASSTTPGVVILKGPSGAGKSRLLAEVTSRWAVPVIGGRAYLPERDEPWALARGLLREALTLDVNAAAHLPDLYADALFEILPELEELRRPSRHPIDPTSRRSLAFEGALQILAGLASAGAVIVVDDLQWADATSLDLLHLVVRKIGKLGLVAAYRPEEVVAEGPVVAFLASLGEVERVHRTLLGPLPPDAIADLVEGEDLVHAIVEETDRTPLSVSEVLRVLVDRGLVEHGAGGRLLPRSELAPAAAIEAARAGQQRAIEGRVHRLAPGTKLVLEAVCLAGRELPARIISKAVQREQPAVLNALDSLAGAGLVELGEQGWGAVHDSVGETVVSQLPSANRASLHARMAQALLEGGGELSEVARHLVGAGDHEAAAAAFVEAARSALERFANQEATGLAEAGLALSPAPPARAALAESRAEARARKGDLPGARVDLREALRWMKTGPERARVLTNMAMLASGSEDYLLAEELIDLALVEAGSEPASRAEALVTGAIIDINRARFDRSEARANEALPLFQRIGDASGVARVLDARALATFQAGRLVEAVPAFDLAARLLVETGQLIRAINPRSLCGAALVRMARPQDGLFEIDRGLDLARSLNHPDGMSFCLSMRCLALAALGKCPEAVQEGKRALALAEEINHREWKAVARFTLGRAWEDMGHLEDAEGSFHLALSLSEGMPIFSAWIAARLGLLFVRRRELDQAETYVNRALGAQAPLPLYEARLAQAELLAAREDPDATIVASAALAQAEAAGYASHVPRLRELAGVESSPKPPALRQR